MRRAIASWGASASATTSNGVTRVQYSGNDQSQRVLVGLDSELTATLPGDEVFALKQRTGTQYSGLTGVRGGSSADQGTGYLYFRVRHDATSSSGLGGGITLAGAGANDTLVGAQSLVVDGVAGTLQLGNGAATHLPASSSPLASDFVVRDEHGAEVHLDVTAFNGSSFSATLSGSASVSLDGSSWRSVTLGETDLELSDPLTGSVLHVDTTGMRRAGVELVTFGGTVNVFDVLQGIVDDLDNGDGLDARQMRERLDIWLGELDRNHENLQIATGELGSLSQRASGLEDAFEAQSADVKGLLSRVEDADYSQVILDMSRAESTLQLAQATSVRLLQNSLLNFLN